MTKQFIDKIAKVNATHCRMESYKSKLPKRSVSDIDLALESRENYEAEIQSYKFQKKAIIKTEHDMNDFRLLAFEGIFDVIFTDLSLQLEKHHSNLDEL